MVKPEIEYWAEPKPRVRTIEEIDRDIEEARKAFKAGPKDSIKVLTKTTPRGGTPVGENVVLPKHYARFQIEPIRFIGENQLNFFQGNVVKYILRHDAKNGIEDIRKAQRYARMYELYLEGNPEWAGPDPRDKELTDKFEATFKGFRELVQEYVADPETRARILAGIAIMEERHANGPA